LELAYNIWRLICGTNQTVYDLGAGPGFYSQFLKMRNMDVTSFDANNHLYLSLCQIHHFDLSKPVDLIGKADIALCLEVGEHIDAEFESIVINNICKLARNKIILSWAIPGQGGFGHVNCQPNDYIIEAITAREWAY
ncbi:hypothetical protein RXR86_28735, partial [Pseudomonas aeruginosa]|nr:hypothetical protein [Pseudomonas aeruginosa]